MRPTVCVPLRSEWLALRGRIDPALADVVRTGRATGESRPGPVLVAVSPNPGSA